MSEKKEKSNKVSLKLSMPTKKGSMYLQRHLITNVFQEFELNDAEVKELNSVGGKHWFVTPEQFEKKQKQKSKKENKAE